MFTKIEFSADNIEALMTAQKAKKKTEQKQITLVPIADGEIELIARPELNIEKWSNFIFPTANAKGLERPRNRTWEIELPDGRKPQASLSVIPSSDSHALICEDYDVYIAVILIWYKRGMTEDIMSVSLREIARKMEITLSGKSAKQIVNSLSRLHRTLIEWKLSYNTKNTKQQTVKNQHILNDFDYSALEERPESKDDPTRFSGACYIRLDSKIRQNLIDNITIPINWDSRKKIRSRVGQVFFGKLAIILSTQDYYERTGINLLSDLEIDHIEEYSKYKSQRKRFLGKIQKYLTGKEVLNGQTLIIKVVETADKKDWKIQCFKSSKSTLQKPHHQKNRLPFKNSKKDVEELILQIGEIVGELDKNKGLYITFARTYSRTLIYRALGEFKEEIGSRKGSRQKFFTMKVHAVAHDMKQEWIKPCDKNCKYRPENIIHET